MYYSLFFSNCNYLCYNLTAISLCLRSTAKLSVALVVLKFVTWAILYTQGCAPQRGANTEIYWHTKNKYFTV